MLLTNFNIDRKTRQSVALKARWHPAAEHQDRLHCAPYKHAYSEFTVNLICPRYKNK